MEKTDTTVAATPDGREIVYTTTPGAVLYGQNSHYGFTGVVNRAWIEATNIVGRPYTSQEIGLGWPLAMEPHRLAALQCPKDPTGQHYINTALLSACAHKTISRVAFQRHDYGLMPGGRHELIEAWMDYAIAAHDFAAWLARQGEEPGPHIAAWFKAVGVAPAAAAKPPAPAPTAPPAVETIAQRNARWLAVFDEEKRTGPKLGAQARAIDRIAASDGVTESTAKKAIQKAEEARAESYRAGGVTPIKRGKNTVSSVFDLAKPRGRAAR